MGLIRKHTRDVLGQVLEERARQDAKWGQQDHLPVIWTGILLEEVGEVAQEVNEGWFSDSGPAIELRLEEELIQVAAVAVAWVEALQRRRQP